MRILNLYSGIGGNRKLWGDEHNITAIEYDEHIAKAYQDRYPNDIVVVGDAKQYLLDNYKNFDFVWISPPCQSHTRIITSVYLDDNHIPKYPDMTLYQIISFLELYGKNCKWVVENVIPYYTPLIKPSVEIDRHLYWSNFNISKIDIDKKYTIDSVTIETLKDFDLKKYHKIKNKRQVIRNQVDYEIGKHILDCVLDKIKFKQNTLFGDLA